MSESKENEELEKKIDDHDPTIEKLEVIIDISNIHT